MVGKEPKSFGEPKHKKGNFYERRTEAQVDTMRKLSLIAKNNRPKMLETFIFDQKFFWSCPESAIREIINKYEKEGIIEVVDGEIIRPRDLKDEDYKEDVSQSENNDKDREADSEKN